MTCFRLRFPLPSSWNSSTWISTTLSFSKLSQNWDLPGPSATSASRFAWASLSASSAAANAFSSFTYSKFATWRRQRRRGKKRIWMIMRKNISFISYWENFPPLADWIDSQTCEMPIELATIEDPLNKMICSWSRSQGSITSWLIEEFRKIEVFKPHKKENKLPTLKAFNRSLSSSSSPALSSSVSTFERSNSLQNRKSGIRILLRPISYNGFSIWHQKTNTVETEYNCVLKYPSSTPPNLFSICF